MQDYVNHRAKSKISPVTTRKELASLRATWNWGEPMGLTEGKFPNRGLRYPKADEKPPFMTMEEIKRQISVGGEPKTLWDVLYLQASEVSELLAHVKLKATHPWIYPLFCFAAHTGTRRSEILRASVADVDFSGNTVLIQERKRVKGQRTTRRVPLTPFLKKVLRAWLAVHPGGPKLFCQAGEIPRSKKRSRTTGHQSPKNRPSSLKDRMATVKKRRQPAETALTCNEVHDHFKRVLTVPSDKKTKKPAWWNTRRYSTTPAYSSTNLPAQPGCSSSSCPTTLLESLVVKCPRLFQHRHCMPQGGKGKGLGPVAHANAPVSNPGVKNRRISARPTKPVGLRYDGKDRENGFLLFHEIAMTGFIIRCQARQRRKHAPCSCEDHGADCRVTMGT